MRAAEILEVPPRQAVLQRHDDGIVAEKRGHLRRDGFEHIGFERQEHQVLRAGFATARHRAHVADVLFPAVVMEEPQPVRANRVQMRTLVDDRDRLSG